MEVRVTDCGGGRFEIRSRDALAIVDLLPEAGGAGDGFRSVELLLGGLAACTAGTVRTYAVNHDVAGFEGIDVLVRSEEASAPERVGTITIELEIRGELSADDLERLRVVSGHCKVHNTLVHSPTIGVQVVSPSVTLPNP